MAENEGELKIFLMKEKSEKVGLKLNIQKTKILHAQLVFDKGTKSIQCG